MISYIYIVLVLCAVVSINISAYVVIKSIQQHHKRMREFGEWHETRMEQIDLKFMGNFELLGHTVRFFVPIDNCRTQLYQQIDRGLESVSVNSRSYSLTKKQLFQLEMAGVIGTYDKELAYKWARKLNLALPDNAEKLFGPIAQSEERRTHNSLVTGSNPVGPTT